MNPLFPPLPTRAARSCSLNMTKNRNTIPTKTKYYCREFFVSKGMIADFAIHDKGDGNPHAHILLTMRAMDEKGRWLPKCCKVYDLDESGERIRLPSGRWKSHKENTVDWNDQKYAEIWRQGWADTANRYLYSCSETFAYIMYND